MVTSVTDTTSTTTSSSTSSSSTSSLGDYDTFIQLLTTQLQYQDPLDPTDTSEFTSQLVQYSSLEQQMNTNDKLDELISSLNTLSLGSGVGYIGMTVEAEGNELTVEEDGTVDASWVYSLDEEASSVTLTVTDEDGTVVATQSGETASGAHAFTWDGTGSDGTQYTSGDYTLTVTAVDSSGKTLSATTTAIGKVSGVDTSTGSIVLSCGDITVDSSAITGVTS